MRLNPKYRCPIPGCNKVLLDSVDLQIHIKQFHDVTLKEQIKAQETTELPKINMNRHIFISGQTQSGKSVFGKFIFVKLPPTQHAIFYDYKNDPNHSELIKHFPVFKTMDEIKDHFKSMKTFTGKRKDMRVIYRPERIPNTEAKTHSMDNPRWKQINSLAEFVYNRGNTILFIDEVSPFTTPQSIPPSLYDCYIMGASRGVVVVTTTQRPNVIHNTMISEAYTRVLFRHELESDRMKLKGIVGAEVAEHLHSLPERKFIISYVNGQFEPGELTIPKNFQYIL